MDIKIKFIYSEIFDEATYKAMERYYSKKSPLYPKERWIELKENLENFWKNYRKVVLEKLYEIFKIK